MNSRRPATCLARHFGRLVKPRVWPAPWPLRPSCDGRRFSLGRQDGAPQEAKPDKRSPRLSGRPAPRIAALVAAVALVSVLMSHTAALDSHQPADASIFASSSTKPAKVVDDRDPSLPRFRLAEIRKHGPDSDSPWVIYGDKVYDITQWIPAHPGGQVILHAAGGSIEPYWNIFTIHKNDYVYEILSNYCIGYVHQADLINGKPPQEHIQDPFADDPARHPSLIVRTAKPCNAETPEDALSAHFVTANDLFYVRNHMWVPKVSPDDFVLTVELHDGTVKQYTLVDLKTKFAPHKITAVLQCSGNRRSHMSQGSGRPTNGLAWDVGAISNASWEGVRLSDVLNDAGFDVAEGISGASEVKHVHFSGMEAYGSSIPLKKAVDPQGDVLLAYSMNDEPLPRDHGFPLRAVVPGHVAARSVKWLSHIALSDEESTSQWQRRDYKCFGPNQTKVDWDAAPAIQELPVQSAMTRVQPGGWVVAGQQGGDTKQTTGEAAQRISLEGYAFSGGGRAIIRVDVSLDGGKSWTQARLVADNDTSPQADQGHAAWAWKQWRLDTSIPLAAFSQAQAHDGATPSSSSSSSTDSHDKDEAASRRCTTVVVKATDDAYNSQPESHAATWNLRGNLATAWHRVQVCADCSPKALAAAEAVDKPGNE
ncbi:hypothetical protein CDD82_7818 [Ophiocordyceps australis]|uniref:Nitrate reductase [NADPH] n=1 Tax=Ophiocordyceps australis TaxID=1399860 RepID=A0A2C5YNN8_9HYPO|nr:hypothetical protein CDD82_7818 [Ophiocordyceps australis]